MTPQEVVVDEVTAVTPGIVYVWRPLVPELSASAPPLTETALEEIVRSPATVLLVARATARVAPFWDLSRWWSSPLRRARGRGSRTWSSHRRPGAVASAPRSSWRPTRRAAAAGSRTVDLTSRPARRAANRLYVRLGFDQRQTNVYRKTLD